MTAATTEPVKLPPGPRIPKLIQGAAVLTLAACAQPGAQPGAQPDAVGAGPASSAAVPGVAITAAVMWGLLLLLRRRPGDSPGQD